MIEIVIKIKSESDFYEKYSDDVSLNLINYIIDNIRHIEDDIKLVIDTKLDIKNIEGRLKEGFSNYYKRQSIIDKFYDNKQFLYIMVGILLLIISTFIDYEVPKEIIIIAGWVSISEVIDIALNIDVNIRIKRKLLKKLLRSEIEVIR